MRLAVVLSVLFVSVNACSDDHGHGQGHAHAKGPVVTPPSRPLEWGDINFFHTTDTHGWLLGHQKTSFPEPNYSGTLGDFASFVTRMQEIAKEKDVDVVLIDSGDLHDGTGLSDGFPVGGVDGHDSNKFLKQLPYDVMAIGNHELYNYTIALDMHKNFAPALNGRYLTSNVNITMMDKNNNTINVPIGERYRKFKTRKGRSVTAFGVLYDFTDNDNNTTVQKVEDMVNEPWFQEAITEEPDIFLLAGHMPVSRDNWPAVFKPIREKHPRTPIVVFGGHTHIRDCVQLDGRSMSLESGRYLETVGWMSMKRDDSKDGSKNITFSRRYLDANPTTYKYHTNHTDRIFQTRHGHSITQGLQALARRFDLDHTYGIAPQDFTMSRAPYPSNDSLLSLYAEKAMPFALATNNTRASIPNCIVTNTGSIRFDLYKGNFTKNDQITVAPFTDKFLYISNVSYSVATKVLQALNDAGANARRDLDVELFSRGYVGKRYAEWLEDMDRRSDGAVKRAAQNLTLGYVTHDSCPGIGDDTLHAPLPFFSTPDFIGSCTPDVDQNEPVDLVFVDFIEDQLLGIVNSLQSSKTFSKADVQSYSDIPASEVLGVYARDAWN